MRIHDDELTRILADDCPFSDLTTEGLGILRVRARLVLTARRDMIVCGVEEAARMFELAGAGAHLLAETGKPVAAGVRLLEATGSGGALHRTYKMAQTLVETLSGISTATRAIVTAAQSVNPACRVACTRKHMPGMKRWALRAIEAGGATPHRLGLSDSILIFEQHRALLDDDASLPELFARLRSYAPERRIAAEAEGVDDAIMLAKAGAEIVQVDKMSPEEVARVRAELLQMSPRPLLAVAGGVIAANAAAFAAAGADLLVTSAPYYAAPSDVKARITKA